MKVARLTALLALMASLAAARVFFPPGMTEYAVVEPIQRATPVALTSPPRQVIEGSAAAADNDREEVPGNAFAVRVQAPTESNSSPSAPIPSVRVVTPSSLPPPTLAVPGVQPPAMQVIGTYDDGSLPAVFVATPTGTFIARAGSELLADYRVTAVSPLQVSMLQVSTRQTFNLPVPTGTVR